MSYVSRWIKENPENIYQVKLTNGKFIAQISINEIVLFESSEDDLHRCVYILENDVRRHYEKTGRVS